MFSFSALSLPQTQHMETFSERPWLREKKSKAPDILFLLSFFNPPPPPAPPSFKLIELHTSARHMSKYPFNEYTAMRSGIVTCDYEIC